MIPPGGFKAELYPLRHKFKWAFGLNGLDVADNSTMITIAKNYKGINKPVSDVHVNPHNPTFMVETGSICAPMSIIEKIKISMSFNLTEDALADGIESMKIKYMPIFTSFGEKLDSADDRTTTTAAAVLELTKDATQEDITPAYAGNIQLSAGNSSLSHPASSINLTEAFGIMNLSVDTAMEGVTWDNKIFFDAMKYYTNKGAIQSMVGRMRTITLTKNRPNQNVFINKPAPRAIRRIVPYSFFGMLFHIPLDSETDQLFFSGALTTNKCHIGVKIDVSFNEWNVDHYQDVTNP